MSDHRDLHLRRQMTDRHGNQRRISEAQIRFLRSSTSTDEVLHGKLLDASTTGLRLLLDDRPQTSDTLLIEARKSEGDGFNLSAQVVWTEPSDGGRFHVGCKLYV